MGGAPVVRIAKVDVLERDAQAQIGEYKLLVHEVSVVADCRFGVIKGVRHLFFLAPNILCRLLPGRSADLGE